MKIQFDRRIWVGLGVAVVAIFVVLPFAMGTQTYPITIVQGNSMYPTLQNGDLILFRSVSPAKIENGTIIIFVQSETGMSMLDSLIKPVIIHRIIGSQTQPDGTIAYQTKGDNNELNDPWLVEPSQVLGSPVLFVPKAGLIILFIASPQGLVAIVGFITLFYLGAYDVKMKDDKRKDVFLGTFAQMTLYAGFPENVFRKLELAVKYTSDMETKKEGYEDGRALALIDWIKKGGLEYKWKLNKISCPNCSSVAIEVEGAKDHLIICSNCVENK